MNKKRKYNVVYIIHYNKINLSEAREMTQYLRALAAVSETCQYPHEGSQPSVTPVPGKQTPLPFCSGSFTPSCFYTETFRTQGLGIRIEIWLSGKIIYQATVRTCVQIPRPHRKPGVA